MTRYRYYEGLKELAHEVRADYGLETPRVLISDLRRIFHDKDVKVELAPGRTYPGSFKSVRGAYFCDDLGFTVLINKKLPTEPRIFTMAHELKHHLVDQGLGVLYCDASNEKEEIEIGAEIFAAELIFPDDDVAEALSGLGVKQGMCKAEDLVRLKRESATTMSYAALVKKATWLDFAEPGAFRGVKFKKLEETMFGPPLYRQLRLRGGRPTR